MTANRANMIGALTGIRGFAALWVVLYHLRSPITMVYGDISMAYDDQSWFIRIIYFGYLGVDLFAFLSGFIISYTYSEKLRSPSIAGTGRYLWVRLARIYPLVIFILMLYVSVFIWKNGASGIAVILSDKSFWLQFFMLNGWGLEDKWAWNAPSWTVSAEWFCYLLFPLAAPFIARITSGLLASVLAFITLFGTIALMAYVGHPTFDADLNWGLLRIGGEFLTGCWLYCIYRLYGSLNIPLGWAGLAMLMIAFWFSPISQDITVAGFAILVIALAHNQPPLRILFSNRASVFLGEISYSIYMLHHFVIMRLVEFYGTEWRLQAREFIFVTILTVLIAATISYFLVEKPSRKYLRKQLVGNKIEQQPA